MNTIFENAKNPQEKTRTFRQWLQRQNERTKHDFLVHWVNPHMVFNVACNYFNSVELKGINWHRVYKENDLVES